MTADFIPDLPLSTNDVQTDHRLEFILKTKKVLLVSSAAVLNNFDIFRWPGERKLQQLAAIGDGETG